MSDTSNDYRASRAPLDSFVAQIRALSQRVRSLESAAPLRQAGVRATPLRLSSSDYDGADHDSLGTSGWMLGADSEDGPSYLALNGIDVYEDLAAKDVMILGLIDELTAAQAALAAQAADLAAQAAYQASLISRDASIGSFNTGTLTNDADYHLVGAVASLPIAIPTGKVRVTISSSEASISPGSNSVLAIICYAIDGIETLDPGTRFARLYVVGQSLGSSLTRIGTVTLAPGTYTIRAQCAYWSAGSSSASIQFTGLRLLAEVIGSS